MPFAMEIGGAHVSLEGDMDGGVTLAIDKADVDAEFGSVAIRVTPEVMETLRDAAVLVALAAEREGDAAVLRRHADEMDKWAKDFGQGFLGGYFGGIAGQARVQADKAQAGAERAKAELAALKAEAATPAA